MNRSYGFLVVLSFVLMVALSGCSRVRDVNFLRKMASEQKAQEGILEKDTKRYEKVLKAIQAEKLLPGVYAEDVISKYGEPVITLQEQDGQKFVYKPGEGDWFGGGKVYLFFDEFGQLTSTEVKPAKS